MAIKELDNQNYEALKADLTEGYTNDAAAAKYHLGLRKVRLVRRSKSYKSYLALRAAERRKQAQNTPAKAVAGEHELAQGEDIADLLINTGKDGEPVDEAGKPIVKQPTEPELPPLDEVITKPRKKKSDAETFGEIFFWVVCGFAVIGVIASVWFIATIIF